MAGAALGALEVQISWQAQHFEPPVAGFVAGAALCALELQISWQAQHFEHLSLQGSWQAQRCVQHLNLEVQIAWQARLLTKQRLATLEWQLLPLFFNLARLTKGLQRWNGSFFL